MTTLEEVNRMQNAGMNESQIVSSLKSRGISEGEVMDALNQGKIMQAVSGGTPDFVPPSPANQAQFGDPMPPEQFSGGGAPFPGQDPNASYLPQGGEYGVSQGEYSGMPQAPSQEYAAPGTGEYSGMQPSMVTQDQYYASGEEGQQQDYAAAQGYQDPYASGAYSSAMYQPYQEALNSDVITEIAEQVVAEKLDSLHGKIEKIIDMKTIVETNMMSMNERLKRMEAIVDQMQISLMKKVGEYMNDVSDLKQELQETQKSFVAIQKKPVSKGKKK